MAQRSGSADLPLHGGRVPEWLASRMALLGRVICEAIVLQYGRQELLRRFAYKSMRCPMPKRTTAADSGQLRLPGLRRKRKAQ